MRCSIMCSVLVTGVFRVADEDVDVAVVDIDVHL
tara:strand:- start:119 stop:220 length:102 start_codon:yes stop_codon:yes gene_type:complete